MSEDVMLREAVEAISSGQHNRARDLLTRLLRSDQDNPTYWIWMSAAVDTPSERIYCLEKALRLDPQNQAAIRGLVILGARPAAGEQKAAPLIRRKWGVAFEVPEPPKKLLVRIYENPVLRFSAFALVGLFLVGILLVGIFGIRAFIRSEPIIISRVSITPEPRAAFSPTPSLLATNTAVVRSPTPTFIGPTPLVMLLEATYTPAPLYIKTPHGISEAYNAGLRAYVRQDYPAMLDYMRQASQIEPQSPDLYYYVGEAYRLLGEYDRAIEAYSQAIEAGGQFAPAYVGRARVLLLTDPSASIDEDLQRAAELDPKFIDTYVVQAAALLRKGGTENAEFALEILQDAEELDPNLAIIFVYRSQAYLVLGKKAEAFQSAEQAHKLDFTSLPAYLALGRARLANGRVKEAVAALNTYLLYQPEDANGWLDLGQAFYAAGSTDQALKAFDQALDLKTDLAGGYYQRALVYIDIDEGQKAVNDLTIAQRMDPSSFEVCIELGHALLVAGRPNEAYRQVRSCESLIEEEEGADRSGQFAVFYSWRATALETLGNPPAAIADWQALLALPDDEVPGALRSKAEERLSVLLPTSTPTITETPLPTSTTTSTPRPTQTPSPTFTSRPTRSPSPSLTPRPTRSPSPTATPRASRTPTKTP